MEICAAAGWASPSTFARFYNLEVPGCRGNLVPLGTMTWARCGLYELRQRPRGLLLLVPWALQCPWQVRCSPPHHSTAWLYWFPICVLNKRRSTSEVSKGNVLGYYRNLGSLRYGNEYCVPCRAMALYDSFVASVDVNLRILW